MLASLFRGNSAPKANQYVDSVTDDAHTKNLLFGQSQNVLNLAISPPASAFGSPPTRPSSFDDYGGLELDEKDIRVLLAQDAHGEVDKTLLLFDSKYDPNNQPAARVPIPANWHNRTASMKNEELSRHRSSTFSGSQNTWSKASRGTRPEIEPFLSCMFGAKFFKKTDTSTKLHIIPAKNRHQRGVDTLPKAESRLDQRRRVPLARAHTSGESALSVLDTESKDCLLITRLFQVTLEDGSKIVVEPASNTTGEKRPKLVETKLPQYAVGFVLQLPHTTQRPRSPTTKFHQSMTAHSFNSIASSFDSDLQSSWTFLDAVPASLSSSINMNEEEDRRLDMIVDNWDVVLRTMAFFERKAATVLKEQLEAMLKSVEPRDKLPKDKSIQRINQLMIAIHDPSFTMSHPALMAASVDVARRIAYALRIPRVVTGLGITAGHWTDEARMLYRVCGGKQQNFFLFNLLTAFLGNHIAWLERLAPEWYRNQFEAKGTAQDLNILASRTIICSEQKGLARRLVYILASFLPNHKGISGLSRAPEQGRLAFSLSPTGPTGYASSRRSSKPYILRPQASKDLTIDKLSCSASSQESHASTLAGRSPRKHLNRRPSNTISIRNNRIESDVKIGAGTTSAIMPQAMDTPAAYIHSLRGSYFPESAIVETNDSVATADLSKVLRKASTSHRRTSSVSSRWGSLVSGISEIWSKPSTTEDRRTSSTMSQGPSPVKLHQRSTSSAVTHSQSNALQMMVNELDINKQSKTHRSESTSAMATIASPSNRPQAATPKLQVDDKDGVIDVELDLPGFLSPLKAGSPAPSLRKRSIGFSGHGVDSGCSARSINGQAETNSSHKSVNVGGYLRRHHEDFTLHAVRPYENLVKDVKRAMLSEPTPKEMAEKAFAEGSSNSWIPVCQTLIADIRTYSVRRFTLRRQYEVRPTSSGGNKGDILATSLNGAQLVAHAEEIMDETVMEFDTTLADAIEKVLNVSPTEGQTSRVHSRNVSMASSTAPTSIAVGAPITKVEGGKLEQRDLVLGALEDVVRSVNDDLNRPDHTRRSTAKSGDAPKQENALREGVKKWMIDVEDTATAVW